MNEEVSDIMVLSKIGGNRLTAFFNSQTEADDYISAMRKSDKFELLAVYQRVQ